MDGATYGVAVDFPAFLTLEAFTFVPLLVDGPGKLFIAGATDMFQLCLGNAAGFHMAPGTARGAEIFSTLPTLRRSSSVRLRRHQALSLRGKIKNICK